jgi:hypothetical protein
LQQIDEAAKPERVLPLEDRRLVTNAPSVDEVSKLIEGTLERGAAMREAALSSRRKKEGVTDDL